MAIKNTYLELLFNHSKKIQTVIENKENYNENVYNCILAGLVIQMNAVIEASIMDFHSESFSRVVEMIYTNRQLLVHYLDYRTLKNMETISLAVIKELKKAYKYEEKYFTKLLKYKDISEHNVVVSKNKSIVYDEFTKSYILKNDLGVEISVSQDKVIKIQDLRKKRDLGYIINCESNMTYFKREDNYETAYYELIGYKQVQDFFINNFKVIEIDYNKHKLAIRDVLDNFYKEGNFNALKTEPKNYKGKPLFATTSAVLDKFFNENIVYKQLLEERNYTSSGAIVSEYFDFENIKNHCKQDLLDNYTTRDYFFLTKSISMFNALNETILANSELTSDDKNKMIITMLINWNDHTIKHFSERFIEANQEFKDMHLKLINYRNFFSHNILQLKKSVETSLLNEYIELAKGYLSVLNSLNVEELTLELGKEEINFLAIERAPNRFVSRKYEQYVQLDPVTYLGEKLFYSSKGSKYNKIIGLVVADKKHPYRGSYYEKRNGEFVAKTFKTTGGKTKKVMVSKVDYENGYGVTFDVNCNDLLYLYAACKGKIDKKNNSDLGCLKRKRIVVFNPSYENNYLGHAIYLDNLITDYYQQKYLPFELVKPTKIVKVYDEDNKGYYQIVDASNNEVIADVVEENKLEKYNVSLDEKGYFTINETIHNFKRKRS